MKLKFHKMHGLGNDFILIDNREQSFQADSGKIKYLADRRTGIGCDQVLLLNPPELASNHLDFRIFNADGSEAEQCGNGMRCITLYLAMSGEIDTQNLQIAGIAGVVDICWQQQGTAMQASINMGQPSFSAAQIPLATEHLESLGDAFWQLDLNQLKLQFYAVSMGNPHIVILAQDHPGITLEELSQELENHPAFPAGINIGLIESYTQKQIVLQVYERGSGKTLACGSGACAAMAALRRAGKVAQQVTISQPGGDLSVDWPGLQPQSEQLILAQTGRSGNNGLWMSGPAAYVFQGETDDS